MKERFSSVIERLKITVRVGGEKIKGFFKRNTQKMIISMIVFFLLAGYIATGIVRVEPQTVRIVRIWEPGPEQVVAKPFINESYYDPKFYLSWPRIPGTDIGVKEEIYSLSQPIFINTEVELFSVYGLTGNEKDADKVAYMAISGTIEVTEWDKFLLALDEIRDRSENKDGSRIDFLNEILQYNVWACFTGGYLNENFADFLSRVWFAHKFAEDFNLKSPAEVEEFLKNQRPWYWALGPTYLKQLQEQFKRNVFPSRYIAEWVTICYAADRIEQELEDIDWRLSLIENQKKVLYEGFEEATLKRAELVFSQFIDYMEDRGKEFPFIAVDVELGDFLVQQQIKSVSYSPQDIYVVKTIASLEAEKQTLLYFKDYYEKVITKNLCPFFVKMFEYIDETEFVFWRAAIEESFKNPELQFGIVREDYYNRWLKSAEGVEHFKQYFGWSFLYYIWMERDFGIYMDLSFEIQEKVSAE